MKVYRIALYGLPGAGKTSLLASLAMPRYPHQCGYTCTWQPIDVSAPKDDFDDEQRNYVRGKEWLEEAIRKVSQKNVPTSNPVTEEHLVLEYYFTNSKHQTFRVELVDYAGELLNINASYSKLAKKLRKKFLTMDGILVLVEAPFSDGGEHIEGEKNNDGQTHVNLYMLRQAFSLLRDEKNEGVVLDVPVALVVNKWDRYSDIDYVNSANEQSKLEDFLNSNPLPPHKGLHDVLQSSVTEDNFKLFPISALGACEYVPLDNGKVIERPKQVNPLNAFGVEDAFVWLVERRDAIDLHNFQQKSVNFFWKCQRIGSELLNRFLPDSEPAKQIENTLNQCRKSAMRRWIGTGFAIVIILLLVEATMDTMSYHKVMVIANNPQATHEQLEEAEKWLFQYTTSPYFQHLISYAFFNRDKAQKLLTKSQKQREDFLWESVTIAIEVNLQNAEAPVYRYLKYYPSGSHVQEAQNIKLRVEQQKHQRENEAAFYKVASSIQEYYQDINKLSQSLAELRELPKHPQEETEEMRTQRVELVGKTSAQIAKLITQREWNKLHDSVIQKMQSGDFMAAAHLLQHHQPDPHLGDLKKTFNAAVIKSMREKVRQALEDGHFDVADNLVKEYATLPSKFQTSAGKLLANKLQRKIFASQDEALYEAAQKYLDKEHIRRYLQEAPLQRMAKEVSAYKTYLGEIDHNTNTVLEQLQLKLVQIRWRNVEDDNNIVTVFKNGKQAFSKNNVNAEPNTATGVIGISKPFSAKFNDSIGIKVKVVNVDMMFDDDYGTGMVRKPISEIANGYSLPLKTAKGVITGHAYFEIEGYPKAPPLPEWRVSN